MPRRMPALQMGLALPSASVAKPSSTRRCTGCKMDLFPDRFSASRLAPDGLNRRCKECDRNRRGRSTSPRTHHVPACHECSVNGFRFCGRCKQHKTKDHFRPVKDNPYGFHSRCIQCDNNRRREKVVRVSSACAVCGATFMVPQNNSTRKKKLCGSSECAREYARRFAREKLMRDVYRITEDDYQRMFREQSGKCAICDTTNPGHPSRVKSDRMCVDHDHATGRVRALLCVPCNAGLGLFGDNTERMAAAVRYLLKHKG